MKSNLIGVIFMLGISVICSEASDISKSQLNDLKNSRRNLLQGASLQESETNVLSSRISNDVKGESSSEVLGGYRPLFPPFFPLKSPFASKKMYLDKEYYTRGIDEVDLINNENLDRENIERTVAQPTVSLQQHLPIPVNRNLRFFQQTSSTINFHSQVSSRTVHYVPTLNNREPNLKIDDKHQVTFITYV